MPVSQFHSGNNEIFIGLSTDTKPANVSNGDQFLETDTGRQFTWNGSWVSFINTRVNVDSTALTLTSASASANSADFTNFNGRGVLVFTNVTAISGTNPTLVVTVQGKDVASGSYYTLLAGASITAVGTQLLTVYPGAPSTANVSANTPLSKTWRVSATIGGTTPSVTATIGASVIL